MKKNYLLVFFQTLLFRHRRQLLKNRQRGTPKLCSKFASLYYAIFALFFSSQRRYRHSALFLKLFFSVPLLNLLISNTYSSVTLDQVAQVRRLIGPKSVLPKVSVESFEKGGSLCGSEPSVDLVLSFEVNPSEWIQGLATLQDKIKDAKTGLCDFKASPRNEESFEIRLSYKTKNAKETLEFLTFASADGFVIDHWTQTKKISIKKTPSKNQPGVAIKNGSPSDSQSKSSQDNLLSGYASQGTLINAFEDESQWDRLLGGDAAAFDLNSPELDRFRHANKFENSQRGFPLAIQELHPPFLKLPTFDRPLEFPIELFDYRKFVSSDLDQKLPKEATDDQTRQHLAALKGMNFVQELVEKKDHIRAQQALEILEKSNVAKLIPLKNTQWQALKGHLYLHLAKSLSNKDFFRKGIDIYRDGVLRLAGVAGQSQSYLEFMTIRLVQNLMEQKLYYLAANILTWSKKYSWTQKIEERFEFFRPEVLFQLGLFDEAAEQFNLFYKLREEKPLNASIDRRLVPAAAFRLGDIRFRLQDYKGAATLYSRAIQNVPTVAKFSFEGNWYPEEIALFPHVLFNRAESFVQLGAYQQALKDLRGFLYVAPQDPQSSLILFRIGDLLEFLNAPEEKILNAWRECSYRLPGTLGAKLCDARKAAREILSANHRVKWPRLIGLIEDAIPQGEETFAKDILIDDLKTYINIVLADAFIKIGEPRQAMFRIDPAFKLSASEYLKEWLFEYAYTSFAGSLAKDLKEGHYQEVVKSYEKRRKELLVHQTRPEILYNLASAYEKLNLLSEASQVLAEAERIKKAIGRLKPRAFEEGNEEWLYFRARINVRLALESKLEAVDVEKSLSQLDQNLARSQRLNVEYFTHMQDWKKSVEVWQKIEKTDSLNLGDLRLYSYALKKVGDEKRRSDLLERFVGTWLTEQTKAGAQSMPYPELILELAELRARESSRWLRSLSAYDFLLGLEESKLGTELSRPMVFFRRGQLLNTMGRVDDARQSFEQAKNSDVNGMWGKLASSALKEMALNQAVQSPKN